MIEVKSYLEIFNLGINEQLKYISSVKIFDCWYKVSGVSFQYFYSQPFKPELITELFEGINYEGDNIYVNNTLQIVDICCGVNGDEVFYNGGGEPKTQHYSPFPRTLDDFITDCSRAGIKLYWKVK
jgi:hypothetical protein